MDASSLVALWEDGPSRLLLEPHLGRHGRQRRSTREQEKGSRGLRRIDGSTMAAA